MVTDEAARRLYADLEQRYQLEWADLRVGSVKLQLLQLADLESYLVQHIEAQELSLENFPYWAMVWDGALVLADFLVRQAPQPEQRILELGAGLGLAGLCAAARGHQVTLTDNHPDALACATLSAWKNGLTNATVGAGMIVASPRSPPKKARSPARFPGTGISRAAAAF